MTAPLVAKVMPSGRPTPEELTMLPDYCQARFGKDEQLKKAFAQQLGRSEFLHIHHHCIGLNLLNRAKVTLDKRLLRYTLQQAIGEFGYVLNRWPDDFPLTDEARRGKQSAEMMLQRMPKGR